MSLHDNIGKAILLKDLSNISARYKSGKSRNDLDATVKKLQNTYSALVEVLVNDSNILLFKIQK